MTTHVFSPLRVALALSTFAMLAACGPDNNNNNLTVQDEPAMQLDEPAGGELDLVVPLKEREPAELSPIRVENSGEVPLTLTSIEWVGEKPERIFMAKDREENSTEDACSSEIYYPASDICVLTGAPDFSKPLPPGTAFQVSLHVKAYLPGEANVIVCPDEVPASVPDLFKERYCGAIRIKSDARNDAANVVKGEAVIYLQADRSSGSVKLSVPTLNFTNVIPGFTGDQSFAVVNDGTTPLDLRSILPTDFGQFINIEGPSLPTELAPLASAEFKVTLTIPDSQDPDTLKFNTQLRIESSAPTSPDLLDIIVDNSQQLPPVPQLDRAKISFTGDGDVQPLVITNPGDIPVSLTGVSFEPAEAEDYYAFMNEDDTPFMGPSVIKRRSTSNPTANNKTYKLAYTKPSDATVGLASMIINYNYFVGNTTRNGTTRVILLGDKAMVAYGDIVPSVASFSTKTMDKQTRQAAIYNLGTAPLNVEKTELMALAGGIEEFTVQLTGGATFPVTIPADGIEPIEISFVATDANDDQVNAVFTSTSETARPMGLTLSTFDAAIPDVTLDFFTSFFGNAIVGELLSVEFAVGTDEGLANNAQWVIVKRPANSAIYIKTIGPKIGFIPDQAGEYELLVTSSIDGIDVQTTYSFTAE